MKIDTFILLIHSFSDVITNSSTDIFACKTKQSVKAVEELLSEMCKISGYPRSILSVKAGTVEEFWSQCQDYLSFKEFEGFKNRFGKGPIIIICGSDDNSIPYWLQVFIEEDLKGYRVHMG